MMSRYARELIGLPLEALENVPPSDRAEKWGFYFIDGSTRPR
jgi:hypothetical protein